MLFTCFCCRAVPRNVPYRLNAQFGHLVNFAKRAFKERLAAKVSFLTRLISNKRGKYFQFSFQYRSDHRFNTVRPERGFQAETVSSISQLPF